MDIKSIENLINISRTNSRLLVSVHKILKACNNTVPKMVINDNRNVDCYSFTLLVVYFFNSI